MKYCQGRCRRKQIKSEGTAYNCPFHKSYTVDRQSGDDKPFEVCMKVSFWSRLMYRINMKFFGDFMERNSLRANSRESGSVIKNRKAFRGIKDG